jgi:hypothetical protein
MMFLLAALIWYSPAELPAKDRDKCIADVVRRWASRGDYADPYTAWQLADAAHACDAAKVEECRKGYHPHELDGHPYCHRDGANP